MVLRLRLVGENLGIIAGGTRGFYTGGVYIYKPEKGFISSPDMPRNEILEIFSQGTRQVNIPYEFVRVAEVNGKIIWMNGEIHNQKTFFGKGNIVINIVDYENRGDEIVKRIIEQGVGLRKEIGLI